MIDINTIVANVKKKRNAHSITRTFSCDVCKKSIIKILPEIYHSEMVICSCGKQMVMK